MRYIGNKTKLLPFIEECFLEYHEDLSRTTMCDLFAGTCSVSSYFKPKMASVMSNDLEDYSVALAKNYILNDGPPVGYEKEIERLNCLEPISGKFSKAFSPDGDQERKFFTKHNAMKINAIRKELDSIEDLGMYNFLLCSLLESADKYSNTTGVYGAYLKSFNGRSSQEFRLESYIPNFGKGAVHQGFAEEVVSSLKGDILYLDPPYNNRQYSSNYHVLNCLINYLDFEIKTKQDQEGAIKESKTGLTTNTNISSFSRKREAANAFDKLLSRSSGFKTVFLSYNDEGIMSLEEIENICKKYGKYRVFEKSHKRYKSNNSDNDKKNVSEYIHAIER